MREKPACSGAFVFYSDLFRSALEADSTELATVGAKKAMDYLLTWSFSLSRKSSKPAESPSTIEKTGTDFDERWNREASWLRDRYSHTGPPREDVPTNPTGRPRPLAQSAAETNTTGLDVGLERPMDDAIRDRIVAPLTIQLTANTRTIQNVIGMKAAKECFETRVRGKITLGGSARSTKPFAMLFYGIPGNGKTVLVHARAMEYGFTLLQVSCVDVLSTYQGGTEETVKAIFEWAMDRQKILISFDECEAIFKKRTEADSLSSALTTYSTIIERWDRLLRSQKQIVIVGATNLPQLIDPAILRRLGTKVYAPCPNLKQRYQLIRLHLKSVRHVITDDEIKKLALWTHERTGDDLRELVERPIEQLERATTVASAFAVVMEANGEHYWVPTCGTQGESTNIERLLSQGRRVRCHALNFEMLLYSLDKMPISRNRQLEAEMRAWAQDIGYDNEDVHEVFQGGDYIGMEDIVRSKALADPNFPSSPIYTNEEWPSYVE